MTARSAPPTLAILDVGHGNCAVLEHAGQVAVFDAGTRGCIQRFCREQKIEHIDTLLLSHADADHISGVTTLLRSRDIGIGRVRANADAAQSSQEWEDMLYTLDQRSRDPDDAVDFQPSLTARRSDEYDVGDVHVEVVGPSVYLAGKAVGGLDHLQRRITANSLSAVIRLHHRGRPLVLLPGDLDEIGLDDLERVKADLQAEVLVYPHHGGRGRGSMTEFAARMISAVRPGRVVFSNGRGVHGTPRPEIIDTIRRAVPDVWIACTQLSDRCPAQVPAQPASHLSQVHARGRQQHSCCAGTLVLRFDRDLTTAPRRKHHDLFVQAQVPSALCRAPLPPLH